MFQDNLAGWIGVGVALGGGVVTLVFWVLNHYFVDKKELKQELDPLREKIAKAVPYKHFEEYKKRTAELHGDMRALAEKIDSVEEKLGPIQDSLTMLVQHHLDISRK